MPAHIRDPWRCLPRPGEALLPPAWRERDYAYEVDWRGGRLPVRIELTGVSGWEPVRLAYLNHLEIAPLNP